MDVEAVKERGRAMGLQPRRLSVSVGRPQHRRKWRVIPAAFISSGDTVADHGLVEDVEVLLGDDQPLAYLVTWGIPSETIEVRPDTLYKVFTEVDMTYGKIDGKGAVAHITKSSQDREGFNSTLCGQSGHIVPIPDDKVKRVCAECRKVAEK